PSHATVHAGPHTAVRGVKQSGAPSIRESRASRSKHWAVQSRVPDCSPASTDHGHYPPIERPGLYPHPVCEVRRTAPCPVSTASRSQTEACAATAVQAFQHRRRFTLPEIADPSPQIPGQFVGHPPCSTCTTACWMRPFGASPLYSSAKANMSWFSCRLSLMSRAAYLPLPSTPCEVRLGLHPLPGYYARC